MSRRTSIVALLMTVLASVFPAHGEARRDAYRVTSIPMRDGVQLRAYIGIPAGKGPFPVILVNEEIFGVHEYIRDICRRLAKQGYLAVAPELYARIADLSSNLFGMDRLLGVASLRPALALGG